MDSDLYEQNCGLCVHATLTAAEGTICGLTKTKPRLTGNCEDLVIDPQAERNYDVRDRRRDLAERAAAEDENPEVPGLSEMMADGQLRDANGSIRWPTIIFAILFAIVMALKVMILKY